MYILKIKDIHENRIQSMFSFFSFYFLLSKITLRIRHDVIASPGRELKINVGILFIYPLNIWCVSRWVFFLYFHAIRFISGFRLTIFIRSKTNNALPKGLV